MLLITLLTLPVLGMIAWEDLRDRSIHWWWLPLLALGMIARALSSQSLNEYIGQTSFNLAFLGMQLSAVLLLMLLRHRRWIDPLKHYIGIGDLLFFLVVALGLSRADFVLFHLSGLALSLGTYFLLIRLKPGTPRTVPLAGFMALYLMLWNILGLIDLGGALEYTSIAENPVVHD